MTLATLLNPVVESLPVRHYVYGKGRNAARVSTRFPVEVAHLPAVKEAKTETAAKAMLTKRNNAK